MSDARLRALAADKALGWRYTRLVVAFAPNGLVVVHEAWGWLRRLLGLPYLAPCVPPGDWQDDARRVLGGRSRVVVPGVVSDEFGVYRLQ